MGYRVFRIYPENRSLYFRAIVWDTKREMRKANPDVKGHWGAICRAQYTEKFIGGKWRKTPECGVLHFHRDDLSGMTVAHEWLHATLEWSRRRRLDFTGILSASHGNADSEEERLCYIHGNMVAHFVRACTRAKLY